VAIWSVCAVAVFFLLFVSCFDRGYAAIAAVCATFLYIAYAIPTLWGLLRYGRWPQTGPWQRDRWYRPLAVLCLAGCASPRPAPPANLGRVIAVLPPYNRTGDRLLVMGAGLIDRYVRHADVVTVPDVLLSEARFQLQGHGFEVAPGPTVEAALKGRAPTSPASAAELAAQGGLRGLVLYLELRRWEPDAPVRTAFVIVGLGASLIDPSTGNVVWKEDRRSAPVPTPGEITLQSAYVTAARKVMREMLAPLQAEPAGGGGRS